MNSLLSQTVPLWILFLLMGYFVIFMGLVVILYRWHIKRRRERPPEEFKLLRGPGETLRRRILKVDEDLFVHLLYAAFAPLFVACITILVAARLPKEYSLFGLCASAIAFIAGCALAVRWLFSNWKRRRNDFLGYLGERLVSESLEALTRDGYRVFHDVPAEGREKNFNLGR